MTLADTIKGLLEHDDPRTIDEMRAEARYEDGTITRIQKTGDGWFVESNGMGTFLPKEHGVKPREGDALRVYLDRGRVIGMDIANNPAFFLTPLEQAARSLQDIAHIDRERRTEYVKEKATRDAQYDALPDPLKKRIDRFRDESPAFRIDSEGYELFCCTEAAKFHAAGIRAADAGPWEDVEEFWARPVGRDDGQREPGTVYETEPDSPAERWLIWAWALNSKAYDYDYDRQKKVLGCDDGHSGNTFGGAMHLALGLLRGVTV